MARKHRDNGGTPKSFEQDCYEAYAIYNNLRGLNIKHKLASTPFRGENTLYLVCDCNIPQKYGLLKLKTRYLHSDRCHGEMLKKFVKN